MSRHRSLSAPARDVLALLARSGQGWRHGYDLCRQAGVKSGTLYPLLMRLAAQGFLEAEWQAPTEPGRPPRHAYRLTAAGRQLARENPPLVLGGRAADPRRFA
jgi:DNA-binding PadR family transcriptional regulator